MRRCDFLDGVSNAPGDRRPRTLGGTTELSYAAAEAERSREVFDNLIELFARALCPACVMPGVGFVDLLLQIADTHLELPARTIVEYGHVTASFGRAVRQFQAVHFGARPREKLCQIDKAFLMRQLHRQAPEREPP
jgi:hypothetical protein